jgi:hypothetical protein
MKDPDHLKHHINGISELPADVVIERIFNPKPSLEATPFTYIPQRNGVQAYQAGGENGVRDEGQLSRLSLVENGDIDGEEVSPPMIGNERSGWLKSRRERKERDKGRLRVVAA